MSDPLISCNCCNGKGVKELPSELRASFHVLKKIQPATVSRFSKASEVELTAAHHRIKRMVKLGVIERVDGVTPAQYVTANLKKAKAQPR